MRRPTITEVIAVFMATDNPYQTACDALDGQIVYQQRDKSKIDDVWFYYYVYVRIARRLNRTPVLLSVFAPMIFQVIPNEALNYTYTVVYSGRDAEHRKSPDFKESGHSTARLRFDV